jgi:hypothetical protein
MRHLTVVTSAGLLTLCAVWAAEVGGVHSASSQSVPIAPGQNLGGRMPPDFDREVARVVADLDRIEDDTLRDMNRTT